MGLQAEQPRRMEPRELRRMVALLRHHQVPTARPLLPMAMGEQRRPTGRQELRRMVVVAQQPHLVLTVW